MSYANQNMELGENEQESVYSDSLSEAEDETYEAIFEPVFHAVPAVCRDSIEDLKLSSSNFEYRDSEILKQVELRRKRVTNLDDAQPKSRDGTYILPNKPVQQQTKNRLMIELSPVDTTTQKQKLPKQRCPYNFLRWIRCCRPKKQTKKAIEVKVEPSSNQPTSQTNLGFSRSTEELENIYLEIIERHTYPESYDPATETQAVVTEKPEPPPFTRNDQSFPVELQPPRPDFTFGRDSDLYQSIYDDIVRTSDISSDSDTNESEGFNEESLGELESSSKVLQLGNITKLGRRVLWCELPEVQRSGILERLSLREKKLQEAMFEVISSEASYLRSLNVLAQYFMLCPDLNPNRSTDNVILSPKEHEALFSKVLIVRSCSDQLMADLEKRWRESFVLGSISDIILEHATKNFQCYIQYCANQVQQMETLHQLRENEKFLEVLERLESSSICQNLSLQSFLSLPLQRITQMPLLMSAVLKYLPLDTQEHKRCRLVLDKIYEILEECNNAAKQAEEYLRLLEISKRLEFPERSRLKLVTTTRRLVKEGQLHRFFGRDFSTLDYAKSLLKQSLVHVFLFNDLLILAKRKSGENYGVLEFCPRNLTVIEECKMESSLSKLNPESPQNLLILTILENCEKKQIEMILMCNSESDHARWLEAFQPRFSGKDDGIIYEEFDCPHVQAIEPYTAVESDELSMEKNDYIKVLCKTAAGWYHGERLWDGHRGWFPARCTAEIPTEHARARVLRHRYQQLNRLQQYVKYSKRRVMEPAPTFKPYTVAFVCDV